MDSINPDLEDMLTQPPGSASHSKPDKAKSKHITASIDFVATLSTRNHSADVIFSKASNRAPPSLVGFFGTEFQHLRKPMKIQEMLKFRQILQQLCTAMEDLGEARQTDTPERDTIMICDAGEASVDLIQNKVTNSTPVLQGDVASSHTFYAKEELQFDITFSHDEQLPVSPRCKMNENGTNPGPGDLEAIWNSSASHLPQVEKQSAFPSESSTARVQGIENYIQGLYFSVLDKTLVLADEIERDCRGRFFKGRNEECGSLEVPTFHARIGQLFDRDYVWVVTQTMVSFQNLALWAVHKVHTYKVYPGFWGRILLGLK